MNIKPLNFLRNLKQLFLLSGACLMMSTVQAGQSLQGLYNSFEALTVKPVEIDGQEIESRSAAAVCSSLGYTLVQKVRLKDCYVGRKTLTAIKPSHPAYNKASYPAGNMASFFTPFVDCERGGGDLVNLQIIDEITCARPKFNRN